MDAALGEFEELLDPVPHLCPPAVQLSEPRDTRQGLPDDIRTQESQPGVQVASVEGIDRFTCKLDVLLRHRLLRQPGGFEGVGSLVEGAHLGDQSVSELVDVKRLKLYLDATPRPRPI